MKQLSRYLPFLRLGRTLLFRVINAIGAQSLFLFIRGALRLRRLKYLHSPKSISSLPPELLCEILLHMDMREVCSSRRTCRMFYDTTKSRQFWQRVLCSLGPVSRLPNFKKRLHDCTSQETEQWGIQSLRTYERWALELPLSFQSRTFDYSTTLISGTVIYDAELLPGGRWLIAGSSRGSYLLYDLHSSSPRPQELVDTREYDRKDKTRDCLDSFALWVNTTTDDLCFRIVVWSSIGPSKEGHVTRTYIYEINISEDEDGIHSSAQRIYAARSYLYARRRPSVALSDKYLVEARTTGHSHKNTAKWKLFLCEYNASSPAKRDVIVLLGKTDDSAVYKVFITSDNQVVTIGPKLIAIYSVSQLEQCNRQRASALQRIDLTSSYIETSAPFSDRGYNWMVAMHIDEYWLIRLPRDMTSSPRVITLGHNPVPSHHEWSPGPLTQDATFCLYRDWTAKILTYSWDVEMAQCTFQTKHVRIPEVAPRQGRIMNVGLDMASGRLVFLDERKNNLIVLDTV